MCRCASQILLLLHWYERQLDVVFQWNHCQIPDQWVTKWSRHDSLPKSVDHQGLVMGLKLHCERLVPVQIIFQRLSLPLLHVEEIKWDQWLVLVDNELFPEQLRKLIKRGDVAVRKATKPLQGCTRERTHKIFATDGVYFSRNNHMGVERRKMAFGVLHTCENNLRCYVVRWYGSIDDRLREWLGMGSWLCIRSLLCCRVLIELL